MVAQVPQRLPRHLALGLGGEELAAELQRPRCVKVVPGDPAQRVTCLLDAGVELLEEGVVGSSQLRGLVTQCAA